MTETATHFVWCLPTTEEDITSIIHEIFRQHGKNNKMDKEKLIEIRDNLQFLVDMLTNISNKK